MTLWGNRERYGQGQQRTEKVGGLWRRAASCSERTQLRIEHNTNSVSVFLPMTYHDPYTCVVTTVSIYHYTPHIWPRTASNTHHCLAVCERPTYSMPVPPGVGGGTTPLFSWTELHPDNCRNRLLTEGYRPSYILLTEGYRPSYILLTEGYRPSYILLTEGYRPSYILLTEGYRPSYILYPPPYGYQVVKKIANEQI